MLFLIYKHSDGKQPFWLGRVNLLKRKGHANSKDAVKLHNLVKQMGKKIVLAIMWALLLCLNVTLEFKNLRLDFSVNKIIHWNFVCSWPQIFVLLFCLRNIGIKNFKNLKLVIYVPFFSLYFFSGLDGKMWRLTMQWQL